MEWTPWADATVTFTFEYYEKLDAINESFNIKIIEFPLTLNAIFMSSAYTSDAPWSSVVKNNSNLASD